jgi:hypothetical protein
MSTQKARWRIVFVVRAGAIASALSGCAESGSGEAVSAMSMPEVSIPEGSMPEVAMSTGSAFSDPASAESVSGGSASAESAPSEGLRLEPEQIVGIDTTEEEVLPEPAAGAARPEPDASAQRAASAAPAGEAVQQVFLDFDGGVPNFDVVITNLDGTSRVAARLPSHIYTVEERASIESLIAADVSQFGIAVQSVPPTEGAFSTLTFNGPLPIRLQAVEGGGFLVSGSFGDSDSIDHRNQNPADTAVIAAHLWEFFVQTDPSGRSFTNASGLAADADHPLAARLSKAVVQQSANTAAHELGHLLGVRHHDGFGPPGSGLPSNGSPNPLAFVPPYDGPLVADETPLHLMSTGSTGATPRVRASVDQFFSERSALKLAAVTLGVGELSSPMPEADALGTVLEPVLVSVPNPVLAGESGGSEELVAQTLAIEASISGVGEVDQFRFRGVAGDVWTFELVSTADPSFAMPVVADLQLLLEQPDGTREPLAFNAQSFEGNDPLLLDVELPGDGVYILQVEAPDTAYVDSDGDGFRDDPISLEEEGLGELRTGDYELFSYAFAR